jgi:Na+:H+ antiporter, NhaA family
MPSPISQTFLRFVRSEQVGGALLLISTAAAVILANTPLGPHFAALRHARLGALSVEHWINDGLMAVFFLLVGLELEREIYVGELSNPRKALLPMVAAVGGMVVPAGIHFAFNGGLSTQSGFGIPMATDIAFALAVLGFLRNRIPVQLKIFIVAFAVADDLGAVIVIALVYTAKLSIAHLAAALAVTTVLIALNRGLRVMTLWPYLLGGVVLWWCLWRAGVHASIAGVVLAFTIPFAHPGPGSFSPSYRLEHALQAPVAFVVLPLFALANTAIELDSHAVAGMLDRNGLGIALGLLIGKPLGITVACAIAVRSRVCRLPDGINWNSVFGAGILGGIGFTMSIFISNLAFAHDEALIESSKLVVLCASILAGACGFGWLRARSSVST